MSGREPQTGARIYGIEAIWALPEGNGVGICCQCRTQTELIIDMSEVDDVAHIDLPEQSFTCDGCGTTHWFTIGADKRA